MRTAHTCGSGAEPALTEQARAQAEQARRNARYQDQQWPYGAPDRVQLNEDERANLEANTAYELAEAARLRAETARLEAETAKLQAQAEAARAATRRNELYER